MISRDSNKLLSGEFTENIKEEVTVDFQRFFVKIGGVRFDVKMKHVSSSYFERQLNKSSTES